MSDYSKFYEARDIISDILFQDFVGPVQSDEILTEFPTQYYIMGKLYPQDNSGEVLDLARNPYMDEIETYDESISLSNQLNPSSLGVTCTLMPGITEIQLSGTYAFYEPIPYEKAGSLGIDISRWDDVEEKPKTLWKRHLFEYCETFSLEDKKISAIVPLDNGMQLQVYTHAVLDSGERVITAVLINGNKVESKNLMGNNQYCAFQAVLKLSSPDNMPVFSDTEKQVKLTTDEEQLELQLLYSDVKCYGQGHGCSVEWDLDNEEPVWVSSSWFPSYNLRQMIAGDIEDRQVLSMKFLSEAPAVDIIASLRNFINTYGEWIKNQQEQADSLEERYMESAYKNISKCKDAFIRMNHAVDLLEESSYSNGVSFRAFRLANEALLMQRRQTIIKSGKEADDIDEITWYPFQLAFILHEIPSFIEPDSEERKVVDLLWFPTGGGKTEAYLGISAFVIFLRRLRDPEDDGVTVIMRYTLRLLTLQQFERASMMICACELLRKKYNLGGSEISIGLWVGGNLTPNTLDEAQTAVNKKKAGDELSSGDADPCQIQVCPWCGAQISAKEYRVKKHENRMIVHCPNNNCELNSLENGIPVHIIDEAIYEYLPTFIVATVDKFAQIPLSAKPAALFGISSHKNPPELIIQDELHLISGPLGTITGIYEAAITKLCEKNGIGAKVIASTATIRNASGQIKELYGKKHTQFPPQGISAKDSFFAVEADPGEKPARKYMGVMGIGTTMTTTMIRVSAALLFASRYLAACDFEDEIVDNFWTITQYYNSLRELGGACTDIMDEVQSRFRYLANTKFTAMEPRVDATERYDHFEELTSRMSNDNISKVIQVYLKRGYRNGIHEDVYDFLLASNMISVGVDISRLGTMIVAGQPKTNAEYIQATSRVGRDNPGLVIAVYNPARSRDRSHYEQFLKYHSALYRYVEATSLTPFADRARDKGLQALYVSLCRYLVPGMLEDDRAGSYDSENPEIKKIEDMICDYVKIVDPEELDAVRNELNDIEDEWDFLANGSLAYRDSKNSRGLLKQGTENDRFRVMNSMRNVDAQAGIYLLGKVR